MVSDDTEHTLFVAQALLAHPNDPVAFQRCLAWKLRLWLLGIPAGIGFATLRAILKLWLGFPPTRSGVHSAGNGPAMRSAIIGAYFFDEPEKRREFVAAATFLTHTDQRAVTAALAVAEAAALAVRQDQPIDDWLTALPQLSRDDEWRALCRKLSDAFAARISVQAFAESLGLRNAVPVTPITRCQWRCMPRCGIGAIFAWPWNPPSTAGATLIRWVLLSGLSRGPTSARTVSLLNG